MGHHDVIAVIIIYFLSRDFSTVHGPVWLVFETLTCQRVTAHQNRRTSWKNKTESVSSFNISTSSPRLHFFPQDTYLLFSQLNFILSLFPSVYLYPHLTWTHFPPGLSLSVLNMSWCYSLAVAASQTKVMSCSSIFFTASKSSTKKTCLSLGLLAIFTSSP